METEQPLQGIGRSRSLGLGTTALRSSPPRKRFEDDTPRINHQSNLTHAAYQPNSNVGNMSSNQRLRAVNSFSPYHPPSSMAVRLSGGVGSGGGPSLAAIAGPMGITVVDVMTPQRPWLVLNYSSSVDGGAHGKKGGANDASMFNSDKKSTLMGGSGGISTMAFQPCPSVSQCISYMSDGIRNDTQDNHLSHNFGGSDGHNYSSSSSVLLATARGSGILIWDCSGRALSPLLGRLNASDSGNAFGVGRGGRNNTSTSKKDQNNRDTGNIQSGVDDGKSMESYNNGSGFPPPPPSSKETSHSKINTPTSNAGSTLDAVQSLASSPAVSDRKILSPSPALVGGGAPASAAPVTTSASTISSTILSSGIGSSTASAASTTKNMPKPNNISTKSPSILGDVTSLAWKGPSAPILLSTCGATACLWDLRMSLFSGPGSSGSAARPCSRYVAPNDLISNGNGLGGSELLIHCAYSYDESQNKFATMDSIGVVSVWDDRKCSHPLASFVACRGGGVGLASVPPSMQSVRSGGAIEDAGSRWVTWGIDGIREDDFVVKVWSESVSVRSQNRATTMSTVSADGDLSEEKEDVGGCTTDGVGSRIGKPYVMTSKISMPGGSSARVHPCFSDGILLFRTPAMVSNPLDPISNPPAYPKARPHQAIDLPGNIESPNHRTVVTGSTATGDMIVSPKASPALLAAPSPLSPPPSIVLQDIDVGLEYTHRENANLFVYEQGGWQAELWRIDTPDTSDSPPTHEGSPLLEQRDDSFGAKKIAAFQGGGAEEDILCIAPGGRRGDTSNTIAVDLTLGMGEHDLGTDTDTDAELLLCCLTKEGRFSVYSVPEAELAKEKQANDSIPHRVGTTAEMEAKKTALENAFSSHSETSTKVYRRRDEQSSSWWNQSEEVVFGREKNAGSSPSKASQSGLVSTDVDLTSAQPYTRTIDSGNTQFEMDLSTPSPFDREDSSVGITGTSRMADNIVDKPVDKPVVVANPSGESGDVNTGVTAAEDSQNAPIDPKKTVRVLCPPLCGATFSAGGVGGLVAFNNGHGKFIELTYFVWHYM